VVAERFELTSQAASAMLRRVALALPVGSEFAQRNAVADDVEVGNQDVVAGGPDRLGLTTTPTKLRVMGG
jgi:hypothetical protein